MATVWHPLERGPHSTKSYTLGLRPENIPLQPFPGAHLLPATITLLEPLGRKVLLSVTCGPHLLKAWYQPPVHALLTRLYGPTSARGRITFSTPTLGWHYRRSYAAVSFKRLSCATASVVHFIAAWSMLL
jgi:hypothetical protein